MSAKQILIRPKRELVFLSLAGIFITNALLAELIGGKLFKLGPFVMSLGVIQWPVVFITTDLINEYFGKKGVRRLTLLTVALIIYAFIALMIGIEIPAMEGSPVSDENFRAVFGTSMWIIVGSIIAFMLSQLVDVVVFWLLRAKTEGRLLWLRATGSTAVSQLIDTFVILGIAFYLPSVLELIPPERRISLDTYLVLSASNYSYKLAIAILMTPVIYAGHSVIDRWLGQEESEHLINEAAKSSLDKV